MCITTSADFLTMAMCSNNTSEAQKMCSALKDSVHALNTAIYKAANTIATGSVTVAPSIRNN